MMITKDKRINYICLSVAIGGLLFGFDTAVISGAIGGVKSQFSLNDLLEGWLVSSGLLGCIIGVFATGLLTDRLGRRKIILSAAVMFLISAIGCAFAPVFSLLIFSRLVGGIGVGMASVVSPMYIAEFAPAAQRGKMVSYYQLAITVGILAAYFSNALIVSAGKTSYSNELTNYLLHRESWRSMFLFMGIPSGVFLVLLLRVPESPRWLVAVHREPEAEKILRSVRSDEEAAKELNDMKKESADTGKSAMSLSHPSLRIPLLIGIVLAILQQFSGINAIIYYGPRIFEAAGIPSNNALVFQVIIGAVNLLFTFVAIRSADRFGRKSLLNTGLIGIVISLFLCGLLFHTGHTNGPWLLILMLVYIACFAFSLGPVTWIIINEIFPTAVRVKAVTLCTLLLWIAVWLVGQFFPWLLQQVGAANTFWVFGGFSLINLVFCRTVVKETKGKTLEEMDKIFIAPH